MTTVIVAGALANKPRMGGAAWVRLSWVLGLRRLGFRVFFLEQIAASTCVDGADRRSTFRESLNLAYFQAVTRQFGLEGDAALICDDGREIYGAEYADLLDIAGETALLLNITGHLTLEPLRRATRCKVYLDLDPGYTQYWHANGVTGMRVEGHDLHYTIGENIGAATCPIPSAGITWRHTRQPVVLDNWPVSSLGNPDRFTTVASWTGAYGQIEHGDHLFGQRAHEFKQFIGLPQRVPQTFELAMDTRWIEQNDLQLLADGGWRFLDPRSVAADPLTFQLFVQASGAEFSVAQGIYVETASGWFSDRTTRYLASGKPALVQDTGFSRSLPVGAGLVAFRTLQDAVDGAKRIAGHYDEHCRAAREIAETYFDSDRVLGRLVDQIGLTP